MNPKPGSIYSEGNEVIIPASGESSEDISVASAVTSKDIILGSDLNIITPEDSLNNTFLALTLSHGDTKKRLSKYAQGKTIVHLHGSNFKKLPIKFPSIDEQRKIKNLIRKIDDLVFLHQRKINIFKIIKKIYFNFKFTYGMKMTPRLRFKNFEADWKKNKLKELAPLRGGYAFKSNKFQNTGIPIVRISNILTNGYVGGEFAYYQEQVNDDKYTLPDKATVLAMSGATIGKVAILRKTSSTKIYQNQRVGYFTPINEIDYNFISTIVRSKLFMTQLNSVLVAGAQPNVSPKDVGNFEFYVPDNFKEQQKIGLFFKQIDIIIAQSQSSLDKLLKIKQIYLTKMFI